MTDSQTTREGEVFLQDDSLSERVLEGRVEKIDGGRWRATCELDETHIFIEATRREAVSELHDHFVGSHTTLDV